MIASRPSGVDVALGLGVPGEDDVRPGEGAVPQHEGLPEDLLLGGRPVDADRARELLRDALAVRGDGRRDGGGPEEVVPAAVAGRPRDARGFFVCDAGFLREAGERVVLGEDRDDGRPGARGRDEGGRHSRDAARDREPFLLEDVREERGRLRLLEGRLGELPDLLRDVLPARGGGVHGRVRGRGRGGRGGGCGRCREREGEGESGPAAEGNLHRSPPNGGCVA